MKPKIYVFSNVLHGQEGPCYALAEDGTVLETHWCSNEAFARLDLGMIPGMRSDRHETYQKHYPDGYEMEFIPASAVDQHEGLKRAYEANQNRKPS